MVIFNLIFKKPCILIALMFLISVPTYSQYKLKKVKEFKINSLLDVDIIDFCPKNELYLGFTNSSERERILLINELGEVTVDKILKGQGPDQYVSNLNCMAFAEDGDIWLQTTTHLLLYDPSLVMKKKIPYPSSLGIQIFRKKELFSYFYRNGSDSGFSFLTNPSGTNSYTPSGTGDLIEIYDSMRDELYGIAPVSDRSIYEKFDKSLLTSIYFIIFSVYESRNKLYLTTRYDDEITVYDLRTHKLESRIKINHGEFKLLKLNTISLRDLSSDGRVSLGSRNHKLFSLSKDRIMLDYIKEIPYGVYEQKKLDDPSYRYMMDATYHKLILFDNNSQVSGDIPMPTNGHLMLGLPEDRLLFKIVDPDVEEDFIRYQVFELVNE